MQYHAASPEYRMSDSYARVRQYISTFWLSLMLLYSLFHKAVAATLYRESVTFYGWIKQVTNHGYELPDSLNCKLIV